MADGPLTNLANLACQCDSVGNLVVKAGATSGSNSPAKSALNTRGVTNNGSLVVAFK